MGRGQEGKYYLFCLDHVRQFNASYNYFEGWSTAEVEAFQKDAVIGHRPTWKTGTAGDVPGARPGAATAGQPSAAPSPIRMRFLDEPAAARHGACRRAGSKPLERKSLRGPGPAMKARTACEIKARFKELVKRHHPDANGGDKRSENKLREIIQAYNYLKQAGLV